MNVEVTKLPESKVALKVELTPEEVETVLDRTYKQLVQRVNIPGFRKGKAPRPVLERLIGHDAFLHEATEEAVRWGYNRALDQENLSPIDEAEVGGEDDGHTPHLHAGEPFHFEVTVAVKPEVQLPDLTAISVEREAVEVSDTDVEDLLRRIQTNNATFEPVTRPAQIGDIVTMNITGTVEGTEIINTENGDFEVKDEEIGEQDPILPGLSRDLLGVKSGDIKDIVLSLPETYTPADLAGKTMQVRLLVKEIKQAVLPEIDDDLAQSVSQFLTIDELRAALRDNLAQERAYEVEERLVDGVIEAVVSRTFVEIPPVLVEEELDRMVGDMQETLEQRQVTWQMYLEALGRSEADMRNEMRESAVRNVKVSLVLGAIADKENIEVSGREINAALEDLFRSVNANESERKRLRSSSAVRANLRSRIRRQRAIQKLVETVAGGEEVDPDLAEAVAEGTTGTPDESLESAAVEVGG